MGEVTIELFYLAELGGEGDVLNYLFLTVISNVCKNLYVVFLYVLLNIVSVL